jgi:chromosome segregation ATPase
MTDDLAERLRSQIGDDVQEVYLHEPLFALAADRIEALTTQLAEDADARTQIDHRLEELVGQVDALTAELADEKRMRQEEKAKILRQREQLDAIQKANRNNLPMRRGLQRRVAELEAAEADNARLRELIDEVVCGRGMFGLSADDDLKWAMQHLGSAINTGEETK